MLVVVPGCIWLHYDPGPLDRFDAVITDAVVSLRVGWLDTLARTVDAAASRYGLGILMLLTIAGVAWFQRWRHLTLFLIGVAVSGALAAGPLAPRVATSAVRRHDHRVLGGVFGPLAPDGLVSRS